MDGLSNVMRRLIRSRKTRLYACIILLLTFIVDGFMDRKAALEANLPYATVMDEGYITVPAKNILISGDLNPHYFHYPSLPIYLISSGMLLGYLANAPAFERNALDLNVIGRVTYPFYQTPSVVKGAKLLFSFLSVLVFFFISYTAYKAFDNLFLLFMPALILSLSRYYFSESWLYLNVDIIGAVAVSFFYFVVFICLNRDSYMSRAVVPGLAAGIVIASKYNLFPILLVMPMAILLFGDKDKFQKIALYFIVAIGSFFIFTPYALLDLNTFVSHIAYQVHHYQTGHPGHNISPGFEHLKKAIFTIRGSYGWPLTILGFAGCFYALKHRWKHGLLLLIFPLLFLFYMSSQQVFFPRNILPVITLMPIFISLGILLSYRVVFLVTQRYLRINNASGSAGKLLSVLQERSSLLSIIFVTAVLFFTTPIGRVYGMKIHMDTRNQALQWINTNIPAGSNIFIAQSIGMDVRSIAEQYHFRMIDFRKGRASKILDQIKPKDGQLSYIIAPEFKHNKIYPRQEELSDAINNKVANMLSQAVVIKDFGKTPLWINTKYKASWYEKKFTYMPAGSNARFSVFKL